MLFLSILGENKKGGFPMKATRFLALVLAIMMMLCAFSVAGAETAKRTIVVDGGGDWQNFNSTKSMEKSDANPYPYNELEMLIKEYNEMHPDVEVQLLPDSKTTEREAVVALMTAGEAPDIIFQNMGVYKNTDIGTDWFVPLNDYFEQPNPYEEGNTRWADVFNPMWLEVTRSSNGNYYFCPIDAVPAGLMVNMDLLKQAGIEKVPETFAEFMDAQDKLNEIGVIPYLPLYHWFDIVLEGQMLSSKVEELDVLQKDGVLDSQEFARAITKGLLSTSDPEYQEYFRLIKEVTKYFPDDWQNIDVMTAFLNGEIAMSAGVGAHMRQVANDTVHTFEAVNAPFPLVTEETSEFGKIAVIRGSAGYSTTWQVTNTAVKNDTVDICIDFLMYLTSAENNARMVNTFETTTPANVSAECIDMFKPLNDIAKADMEAGYLDWHACNIWNAWDNELSTNYNDLRLGWILDEISLEDFTAEFQYELEAAVERAMENSGWDETTW